jgi:AraC-like DNA-binding protein
MFAIRHSTQDVPPSQSLEYWHDWVCDTFVNLDCHVIDRTNFRGAMFAQSISSLMLTRMGSDRMELVRSRQRIAKGREDCFLIAIEGRSASALLQDGREGVLDVGDFAIVDSSRPYSVLFREGFEHHVLRIPRREMASRLGSLDAVTGLTFSGSRGAGKIASALCRMLSSDLDSLPASGAHQVAGSLLDLFAVAIGERLGARNVHETATRNAWFIRIRNYIDTHLSDPDLSRANIAQALGVSVRHLSDIFGSNDVSVMAYILERRLHKCHLALVDPAQNGRSISSVAFGWGFNDLSHFGRAFRARYGVSPRELRACTCAAATTGGNTPQR